MLFWTPYHDDTYCTSYIRVVCHTLYVCITYVCSANVVLGLSEFTVRIVIVWKCMYVNVFWVRRVSDDIDGLWA